MTTRLRRLHHITVCAAGAQEDLDFFTQVLGQRLVKQTVLMDGRIPVYHFYYGNADADAEIPALARDVLAGTLRLDHLVTDRITLAEVPAAFDRMSRGEGARSVVVM